MQTIVKLLDELSKEELIQYRDVGKFIRSIQVIEDEEWIEKSLIDNQKRLWIIASSDMLVEFKLRFSKNPKNDIIKVFKKVFNSNISNYSFHFLLVKDLNVIKQMMANITELPLIFETYDNEMHNPIFMNELNFK